MQKQPSEEFFKTGYVKNFAEFTTKKKQQKKHLCRNLFFHKVNFCRSVTLFKQVFSL